jgi:histidinol dehydrogenase
MKTIILPKKDKWEALCKRPARIKTELEKAVRSIINDVKFRGDQSVLDFSERFDKVKPDFLKVLPEEIAGSADKVSEELKIAIDIARRNIEKFHSSQVYQEPVIDTSPGVKCWRKNVPIEKVGLYIPGGSAPLFSTVLMLAIPAKIAGCKEIVICTPPDRDGKANPLILFTAGLLGINSIFKAGGAQAIAAMAYGTETIPKVYKIFGPGNQYVTKAKELIQQDGISIDLPAGPSEVLIIADKTANPEFVAADLLSQAEHGPDSQVILLSINSNLIKQVERELEKQLNEIPRKEIALKALDNSMFVLLETLDDCMNFSNQYAPEHLIINTADFSSLTDKIINAGSVFLGKYSCESAGDYASGTNHTLPTNGYARSYSGVSTESFVKKISFQEVNEKGIECIGPAIRLMAEAELLQAHKNAVNVRLKYLKNVRN